MEIIIIVIIIKKFMKIGKKIFDKDLPAVTI